MMDEIGSTVETIQPWLAACWDVIRSQASDASEKLLQTATAAAGAKLMSWMKEKLPRKSAQTAIEEVEADPTDPRNREEVLLALQGELTHNPDLLAELTTLIADLKAAHPELSQTTQSSTQIGDQNQSVQIDGNDNQVNMG